MDDPVAERQRQLAVALRSWREAASFNQTELARRISYDRTTVAHAERGRQVPAAEFWQACDAQLAAHGALLRLHEEWLAAKRERAETDEARRRAGGRSLVELLQRRTLADGEPLSVEAVGARRSRSPEDRAGGDATATDVAAVRAMWLAFRAADRQVGGGHLYPTVRRYLQTEVGPRLVMAGPKRAAMQLFCAAASLTDLAVLSSAEPVSA
jgi:transcriptional regulator with XRE-family HTH domain